MGTKGHLVMWSEGGHGGKLLYPPTQAGPASLTRKPLFLGEGAPQVPATGPCPLGWSLRDEASREPRTGGTGPSPGTCA